MHIDDMTIIDLDEVDHTELVADFTYEVSDVTASQGTFGRWDVYAEGDLSDVALSFPNLEDPVVVDRGELEELAATDNVTVEDRKAIVEAIHRKVFWMVGKAAVETLKGKVVLTKTHDGLGTRNAENVALNICENMRRNLEVALHTELGLEVPALEDDAA